VDSATIQPRIAAEITVKLRRDTSGDVMPVFIVRFPVISNYAIAECLIRQPC
jgi:hypothetical protein